MRENELAILEQYNIDVKNTRKVRDAVLCETQQGLFLVKEMRISEKRLSVIEYLSEHLRRQGIENIDWILKNKDNGLFSVSEEGTRYFLKKWFPGRECDIHKEKDVLDAVVNLTKIHHAFKKFEPGDEEVPVCAGRDLREEYFRHNREMKKVRSFVRDRVKKGEFELTFLKYFDQMYDCAELALKKLCASDYGKLYDESLREHTIVHGDYNYHNVLVTYGGIATTNFEHAEENIQIIDFYYFLRKVMEKNQWDVMLGDRMIESYQRYRPLKRGELECIAIWLAYPEKFWKAANSYYRSRKTWIPAKNLEKLELVITQGEKKRQFLETIFSFHL